MERIVYVDVFFILNFIMDGVSLILAGLIAGEKSNFWRLFTASLFGAVCSVGILIFSLGSVFDFLLGFVVFVPMILIAFGKISVRRLFFVSVFAFVSALFLGGSMEWLSYYVGTENGKVFGVFLAVLFLSLGAFQLWGKRLKKKMETRVISLSIVNGKRQAQFYGFVDSGAFLRDPESGAPVILLKSEYADDILSPEECALIRRGEGEGVVPIPIQTASGRGCLFAFSPEAVTIHRDLGRKGKKEKREKILVALDFTGGGFAGCPCLVPLSVV